MRTSLALLCMLSVACGGSSSGGRKDAGGASGSSGFVIDNDGSSTGIDGADGAEGAEGAEGTEGTEGIEGSEGTEGSEGSEGSEGTDSEDATSTGVDVPEMKECETDADCPSEKPSCAPQGVCIFCYPGTFVCDDNVSLVCSQFGESYEVNEDCGAAGGTCNPLGGKCESSCGGGGLSKTNAGCDFIAVDLPNAVGGGLDAQNAQFAVIASNTSDSATANVTVTMPNGNTMTRAVAPQSLEKFELPSQFSILGTSISSNSYRVTSDQPITLYQFNPLSNVGVFSNDASVLLPTSSNGTDYYIVTLPSLDNFTSYFTVVATSEGETEVSFTPKGSTAAGAGIPSIFPNTTHKVTLTQGQVLNVESASAGQDLTGTRVTSNKAIAVMSGHTAAVTSTKCCADHLEQQMAPVNTWATDYVIGKSQPRGNESDYVRVVASENNTTVSVTPAVASPSTMTLNAGQFWQFTTNTDVQVSGDKPIMVAQFLASSQEISKIGEPCSNASECGPLYTCEPGASLIIECTPPTCATDANCPGGHVCIENPGSLFGGNICYPIGDPALILAVPVAQWQNEYVFLTPDSYAKDYITIVTQTGITVKLDGVTIGNPQPVGGTNYQAYRQLVPDGVHRLSADGPMSVTVYGYDQDVSYGYPGGLGLSSIQ